MDATDLRARLESTPPEGRERLLLGERLLLELIRESAADLLGFESARDVDPDRAFADFGFTSVAAVELSRILGEATGLELPPTLG
ncbi:MAG TPA: acyl carrier protein, partial [Solirubrobacterales bacterium]|nr:acyl carrier protein [Solirubrobacterales bacterium]